MNLTQADTTQTMSSREIAELTGKRHDHVMRDIRAMLVDLHGEGGIPSFGDTHINEQNGQSYPIFRLPKRESLILVSGYSVQVRARIIDRWQELEARVAQPAIPAQLSRLQLIEIAMQAEQERLVLEEKASKLEEKVAEQAPKVAFANQVQVAPDAIDFGKAAKLIGTGRTRLMAFAREIRWLNRFNQPYQDKIEAGLLDVKLGSWEHPDHGLQQSVTPVVTGKGLVKLQSLWDARQHAIGASHMQPPATQPGSGVQA